MIIEWLRQQKILTPPEIAKAEEEFRSLGISQKEELQQVLHEYFVKAPLSADRRFWFSYFRWYVDLTWRLFSDMSEEVVTSVAFARQLIMAIVLGYDPVDELMTFLNNRPFDEESMSTVYGKIRDGVLKSGAIIGIVKGREVTYAEIVRELTVITQANDMLRLAEFTSRLKEVLFPRSEETMVKTYLVEDQDATVSTCMNALSFFIGVEPSSIWSLVRTAFHPEYFAIEPAQRPAAVPASAAPRPIARPASNVNLSSNTTSAPVTAVPSAGVQSAKPSRVESERPQASSHVNTPAASRNGAPLPSPAEQRPGTPGRPSNKEIRSMVEALFPPNEQSEDERLPKILNLLETLSIRYGDESIRDVYFFNSDRGRFEWLP